jgi:S1-C subfamily serine protease
VIELGGKVVTDLQTYSDALYSHKPGDEVEVVVSRQGQPVRVRVKLGRRG